MLCFGTVWCGAVLLHRVGMDNSEMCVCELCIWWLFGILGYPCRWPILAWPARARCPPPSPPSRPLPSSALCSHAPFGSRPGAPPRRLTFLTRPSWSPHHTSVQSLPLSLASTRGALAQRGCGRMPGTERRSLFSTLHLLQKQLWYLLSDERLRACLVQRPPNPGC